MSNACVPKTPYSFSSAALNADITASFDFFPAEKR